MYSTYCRLNLHVSASDIDVIRAIRTRFKVTQTNREGLERRKEAYRAILECHHKAQKLFRDCRF